MVASDRRSRGVFSSLEMGKKNASNPSLVESSGESESFERVPSSKWHKHKAHKAALLLTAYQGDNKNKRLKFQYLLFHICEIPLSDLDSEDLEIAVCACKTIGDTYEDRPADAARFYLKGIKYQQMLMERRHTIYKKDYKQLASMYCQYGRLLAASSQNSHDAIDYLSRGLTLFRRHLYFGEERILILKTMVTATFVLLNCYIKLENLEKIIETAQNAFYLLRRDSGTIENKISLYSLACRALGMAYFDLKHTDKALQYIILSITYLLYQDEASASQFNEVAKLLEVIQKMDLNRAQLRVYQLLKRCLGHITNEQINALFNYLDESILEQQQSQPTKQIILLCTLFKAIMQFVLCYCQQDNFPATTLKKYLQDQENYSKFSNLLNKLEHMPVSVSPSLALNTDCVTDSEQEEADTETSCRQYKAHVKHMNAQHFFKRLSSSHDTSGGTDSDDEDENESLFNHCVSKILCV